MSIANTQMYVPCAHASAEHRALTALAACRIITVEERAEIIEALDANAYQVCIPS